MQSETMKTKSKLATDIKSLVMAKSKLYAHKNVRQNKLVADEDIDESKCLRKASEADKERKREKMRLKRQLKRDAKAKGLKKDIAEAKTDAINYLNLWQNSKDSWCFKKNQQSWLLDNAFNTDNISDADFETFLNYIIDLKGAAKSRLIEESEKVIKLQEEKGEDSASGSSTVAFERARSIIQILF